MSRVLKIKPVNYIANRLSVRFGSNLYPWLVTALITFFVIVPMAFLILGSLSTERLPTDFSLDKMTYKNYTTVYLSASTYKILWNTLFYVTGSVLFSIFFALLFAWLVERTNLPLKPLVYAGVPLVLAMPGILVSSP
jgi:iron(III) transport system permease protein